MPKPPIPLNQFCADETAVERIRQIVADPSYQQAVACLKELQTPQPNVAVRGSKEINNNLHIFYAGYCAAFDDLEQRATKLALPQKNTLNQTDEWTHIQPNKK